MRDQWWPSFNTNFSIVKSSKTVHCPLLILSFRWLNQCYLHCLAVLKWSAPVLKNRTLEISDHLPLSSPLDKKYGTVCSFWESILPQKSTWLFQDFVQGSDSRISWGGRFCDQSKLRFKPTIYPSDLNYIYDLWKFFKVELGEGQDEPNEDFAFVLLPGLS